MNKTISAAKLRHDKAASAIKATMNRTVRSPLKPKGAERQNETKARSGMKPSELTKVEVTMAEVKRQAENMKPLVAHKASVIVADTSPLEKTQDANLNHRSVVSPQPRVRNGRQTRAHWDRS